MATALGRRAGPAARRAEAGSAPLKYTSVNHLWHKRCSQGVAHPCDCEHMQIPGAVIQQWSEERLRYQVLRAIYERAGADCTRSITATEIGARLEIDYENLFRVLGFLEEHQYLLRVGPEPLVCITLKGIRYIEKAAGRRQSLRVGAYA